MKIAEKLLKKCNSCGRIFAIRKTDENVVRTEDVAILEVLRQPHLKGEVHTMVERFVPGQRIYTEISYECKFCGKKHTVLHSKDVKNDSTI